MRVFGVVCVTHAVRIVVWQGGTTFGQVVENVGSSKILVNPQTDIIFLEFLGETGVRLVHHEAVLFALIIVESLVNVQQGSGGSPLFLVTHLVLEVNHGQGLWGEEAGERLVLTGLEKSFLVKNLELSVYLVNVEGEAIEVSFFIVRQLNI